MERLDALELRLSARERIDHDDNRWFSPALDPPPEQQAERDDRRRDERPEPPWENTKLEQRARRLGNALRGVRRKHASDEHRADEWHAPLEAGTDDDVGEM
jgi:hypothetical protein